MESRRYPTDLSDDEWRCISPHLPEPTAQGRPRLHGLRAILDAVFYVLKSGCPWRMLPKDFPPWKTVYDWFRRWRLDGTWERLNTELRERLERLSHLWVDAGYQGRGRRWAQEALGLSVEVVRKPRKPVPEDVAKTWAQEWAKEGKGVDWRRLMPPRGFSGLAEAVGGGAHLRLDLS